MSVFSRLESLGIKNISKEDLYDQDKRVMDKADAPVRNEIIDVMDETNYVFEKKYTCPVCDKPFTSLTFRTGKIHPVRTDLDLRPVFVEADPVKYEVISCPNCGHAAHSRIFGKLSTAQAKLIKEGIGYAYRRVNWGSKSYSYEQAKTRYELAIANSIVGKMKTGERAHLCLKLAWVIRGERERFDPNAPDYAEMKAESEADELEMLGQALEGFVEAKQTEVPPIGGMDSGTLDYLMAALYYETGKYDECRRLVGKIMVDRSVNMRVRDKADRLRDLLREQKEAGN